MLPTLNITQEIAKITQFIKNTVTSRGFGEVVIACSGGIDSATSLFLAVKALGADNVHAFLLPYGAFQPQSVIDATLMATRAGLTQSQITVLNIQPTVEVLKAQGNLLRVNTDAERIRLGNIMARVRMILLYDCAKRNSALVIGTENKSEHYLGYFTRFGDEASDIEPIKHLYKTQVFELARALSVPSIILEKAPTAGLWEGQTDEGQFGFSYKDADQILYGLYKEKLSAQEIMSQGFSKELIEKVQQWVEKNHFKHELPLSLLP